MSLNTQTNTNNNSYFTKNEGFKYKTPEENTFIPQNNEVIQTNLPSLYSKNNEINNQYIPKNNKSNPYQTTNEHLFVPLVSNSINQSKPTQGYDYQNNSKDGQYDFNQVNPSQGYDHQNNSKDGQYDFNQNTTGTDYNYNTRDRSKSQAYDYNQKSLGSTDYNYNNQNNQGIDSTQLGDTGYSNWVPNTNINNTQNQPNQGNPLKINISIKIPANQQPRGSYNPSKIFILK